MGIPHVKYWGTRPLISPKVTVMVLCPAREERISPHSGALMKTSLRFLVTPFYHYKIQLIQLTAQACSD